MLGFLLNGIVMLIRHELLHFSLAHQSFIVLFLKVNPLVK